MPQRVEDRSQFVTSMDAATISPKDVKVIPTYRVMDTNGVILNPKDDPQVRNFFDFLPFLALNNGINTHLPNYDAAVAH